MINFHCIDVHNQNFIKLLEKERKTIIILEEDGGKKEEKNKARESIPNLVILLKEITYQKYNAFIYFAIFHTYIYS